MSYKILYIFLVLLISTVCSAEDALFVEEAGLRYQQHKDFTSLDIVYANLQKGMHRKKIEQLLGDADYSPTEGQYYYSSDKSVNRDWLIVGIPVGLVIDYRDKNGMITDILQSFWLGPIGE